MPHTEQSMLESMREVATRINSDWLSRSMYDQNRRPGAPSSHTIQQHFGRWVDAEHAAGLGPDADGPSPSEQDIQSAKAMMAALREGGRRELITSDVEHDLATLARALGVDEREALRIAIAESLARLP